MLEAVRRVGRVAVNAAGPVLLHRGLASLVAVPRVGLLGVVGRQAVVVMTGERRWDSRVDSSASTLGTAVLVLLRAVALAGSSGVIAPVVVIIRPGVVTRLPAAHLDSAARSCQP